MADSTVFIPKHRTCAQMEVHYRLLEQDPGYRRALGRLEIATQARLTSAARFRVADKVTIPVVVQVVYNDEIENISDEQVHSQIDVLNRDYARKNEDLTSVPSVWSGLATDTGIRFVLASKDPNGKANCGIVRTRTTKSSFKQNDYVKKSEKGGADAWPAEQYLNLWVCALGGGLLGYAQFPGGPPATDGVVILHHAFGTVGTAQAPYDQGRTAVHEVGHWLNLRHIWGDVEDCSGRDLVPDTPDQQHPNYGKPQFPHVSCNNGPNGDMFMNYMDYVDDAAMVLFTPGQVARMQATLAGPRKSFVPADV